MADVETKKMKQNHYQIKSPYKLPANTYKTAFYLIRRVYCDVLAADPSGVIPFDFEHAKKLAREKAEDKEHKTKDFGSDLKDPTGNAATDAASDDIYIRACSEAWDAIPTEYREAVYLHIVRGVQYRYLDYAHENTYKRYVQQYVWFVAYSLGLK